MVNYGVGEQFDFNADVFFYVVLPPIIFHQVKLKSQILSSLIGYSCDLGKLLDEV